MPGPNANGFASQWNIGYSITLPVLLLHQSLNYLRIDTGGCSVIRATPVLFIILLICTHQLKAIYLLS